MIEMLNMDCMEYMAKLPDKAFDLAIVDPPYGLDINSHHFGGRKTVKRDFKNKWDKKPDETYFKNLFRVSKNQIIWGGNYYGLPPNNAFVIWDKGPTMTDRFYAECEYAWSSIGGTKIFRMNPMQKDRIHHTQKPVDLYKWLLSKYAKQGDKILDTHGGSGSICLACHDLGFDLTWMELDKDYYEAACKRYKDHAAQQFLFDPKGGE